MPRILLVDDEKNMLSSLRRTINAIPAGTFEDATVVEAFDTPELALVRAAQCTFDLVISDWRMPTMSGIAFLNQLIQIQPQITRFILSADGDHLGGLEDIRRINVSHIVNKPWDNAELQGLLRQALASASVAEQSRSE